MKLNDLYEKRCNTPSDIYQHLPTLRKYASECSHVTEMGVRTIVSTYALMRGLLDCKIEKEHRNNRMVSIDLHEPQAHGGNLEEAEDAAREVGIGFKFIKGNTLEIDIDQTDFLFIDTLHTYPQLKGELERHHGKVNKYIALHDTTTFATRGEDKNYLGLWYAVEEFLEAHPEWEIKEKFENNNGLTVLARKVVLVSAWTDVEAPKESEVTGKIPVFGIPVVNRGDLLLRLVQSIDFPVGKLYIVNNGNDGGVWDVIDRIRCGANPLIDEVVVYSECRNIGVAASWNKIIEANIYTDKSEEHPHVPYFFICANDMCFNKGDLAKMYKAVEENHKDNTVICADGFSCFCITKFGVETVGFFDENFYPAYLEDCDYHYRIRMSGLKSCGVPNMKPIHGDGLLTGSATIKSNPKFEKANTITHGRNHDYYKQKWGGAAGEEKFVTPFGSPDNSVAYWKLDEEFRKVQENVWRTIIAE